jgi:hypothetical protein
VILTGISLVLAFFLQSANVPSGWHAGFEDPARYFGTAAAYFGVDGFGKNGLGVSVEECVLFSFSQIANSRWAKSTNF